MTTLMKNSGIEWIGEIPEGWKVKRIKDIAKWMTGFTPSTKIQEYYNGEDKWVTISDLNPNNKFITETKNKINGSYFDNKNKVPKGSLLFSFKLSVGQVAFNNEDIYTNEAICSFLKSSKVNLNYFYYSSPVFIVKNSNKNIYGAKILNQELIGNAIIAVPPLETQKKIANYLDIEVTKLDKQISLLEKKHILLGDYKEALIFETVTKGLDEKVIMKDSGIDWIGEIPEGWKIKRLKDMISNLGGGNYGNDIEELNSETIISKCFSISDFKNGNLNTKNVDKIKMDRVYDKYNTIKKGTLLIEKCGGTKTNPVGRIIIVEDDVRVYYTNFVQGVKVRSFMDSKYLNYQLQSSYNLRLHMNNVKQTTGIQNFNFIKFSSEIMFLNPPLETQKQIADYLDVEVAKLDKQRELIKKKVELLKQYKEALIFEVVTGKKEVE